VKRRRARAQLLGALAATALGVLGCGAPSEKRAPAASPTTTQARAPLRVRVAIAEPRAVGALRDLSGVTSAFRTATVASEVAGRVVARHVEPGDAAPAGAPLVTLDPVLFEIAVREAEANRVSRAADAANARLELSRATELHREGAVSEGRLDTLRFAAERAEGALALAEANLRRARRAQADSVVRAPFGGSVERVAVQLGEFVAPGAPVVTLADFERVRFVAGATAAEAAQLQAGGSVVVSLAGAEIAAEVQSVALLPDAVTGTYSVEIWLPNPDGALRAGMVGQLRRAVGIAETLAVPRAALLRQREGLALYVLGERDGAPSAALRPVRIGRQDSELVEIVEGVRAGERVVVEGLFALSDGSPVYVDGEEEN
jgi:membrane fusion protein (multidrug efflux system)